MSRPRLVVREGVFEIDGKPRVLLIGDYPYYRDRVENWEARLRAQAEAGLDVLSCYVPWRHHAPRDPLKGGAYDFEGTTQSNRDLVRLVEMARDRSLRVLLKPGPFIHAELAYGGLPDYVDPSANLEIEPELDAHDHPIKWPTGHVRGRQRSLPAPFDATYLRYVSDWFESLNQRVLQGRTWPQGPIIGLQLMNEGIYSDSSNAGPLQRVIRYRSCPDLNGLRTRQVTRPTRSSIGAGKGC